MSDRVARLEQLKLLLAEREYATAGDLAGDLGVSVRTLHRDLATLRYLGLPVEGVGGRGGGVYLERGWSLGRVHLNESEALGLLLALAIARQVNSPLLLSDVTSIERKVARAFAPAQASRVKALRHRVIIGEPASRSVRGGYRAPAVQVTRSVLEAFAGERVVDIGYVDASGAVSQRRIEVHYLYYSLPVWYVLAWDRLHRDVRSFRIDRIHRATVGAEAFKVRAADRFVDAAEASMRHL